MSQLFLIMSLVFLAERSLADPFCRDLLVEKVSPQQMEQENRKQIITNTFKEKNTLQAHHALRGNIDIRMKIEPVDTEILLLIAKGTGFEDVEELASSYIRRVLWRSMDLDKSMHSYQTPITQDVRRSSIRKVLEIIFFHEEPFQSTLSKEEKFRLMDQLWSEILLLGV